MSEMAANGASGILSLAFCFVSGVFMGDISILSPEVQVLAHFTPTYWYNQAIHSAANGALSADLLMGYFASLGVVLLFTAGFFVLALIVARLRTQTTDAGANSAADPT
jgi:ABC-2 type transport system permease protein